MADGSELKDRQRKTWSLGDFEQIAATIASASTALVDRLGVERGDRLLDVGCGTGNATLPAAERGARAIGLDLTPTLLEAARRRSARAGLEIEWVEGDAEALPFDDGSFDKVMSVFGAMFAPDHARTAAELMRVCRADGAVGFAAWTPAGLNGRLLAQIAAQLPPPPPGFQPPVLWGSEDHVGELFAPTGGRPTFDRRSVTFEAESVEDWLDFHEATLGPMIVAKAALEPEGRWRAFRGELAALYEQFNSAGDGSMRVEAEYLLTVIEPAA